MNVGYNVGHYMKIDHDLDLENLFYRVFESVSNVSMCLNK